MSRLRLLLAGSAALSLLAACGEGAKNDAAAPADEPVAATDAPPVATAGADETVHDGGAEQLPEDPIPATEGPPETPAPAAEKASFPHGGVGDLLPGSGSGYADRTDWSPQMCWPMEEVGFPNSQVYNAGGSKGPSGKGQCDKTNYDFPWRDNFCESRGASNPACGSATGHQGQDIRPKTCEKNKHWAVAAEDGVVTDIGSYTVTLTASTPPYRIYRYLHMNMPALPVKEGQAVKKGQRLGQVSNYFGSTPTTIHLHFEMRVAAAEQTSDGKSLAARAFVPPYSSLVKAYERKLAGGTC
jgi:murein DD-endopeptidase MepM/ murein hydrolase activator NlpD